MMKLASPKPFTFEGGDRAVLLLHGFTGNSADVRMLGRFLEKKGYTCHAPIYKGHGVPPEQLVHTGPEDWWKDVMNAYQHLKDQGYEKIVCCWIVTWWCILIKACLYSSYFRCSTNVCANVY